MTAPLISIVIPAFNEEHNIGSVLRDTHQVLKDSKFAYEVIVVNDGSTDRTTEIAKKYDSVLIELDVNKGKGVALRTGFELAKGRLVVTMDADGSHQPEDIPYLIYPIIKGNNIDATIGSRFIDEGSKNSTTKLHLVGNKIINSVILFLTGRYISDSQSGFRVFTEKALKKLVLSSSRYEIESEMIVKMLRSGMRILEVPIRCKQRSSGSSNIHSFIDGFKIIKTILKAVFLS